MSASGRKQPFRVAPEVKYADRAISATTMMRSLIAGLLVCLTIGAEAQELKLTASTWSPYVDDQLYESGVAIAVARTALERAGYNPSLTIGPWPQVMIATQNGTYDILVGVWFTEERSAELAFSEPFLNNEIKFLKRSDSDIRYRSINRIRARPRPITG